MGNFFNNGLTILKLIIRVRIYHVLIYKMYILKTKLLIFKIFFWKFIAVKWPMNKEQLTKYEQFQLVSYI